MAQVVEAYGCFTLPDSASDLVTLIPDEVWTSARDSSGGIRPGPWVAEVTGLLDLTGWPPGMRVIVRVERPHPGAQVRLTDADGQRLATFRDKTLERAGPARSCPSSGCGTAAGARAERTGSAARRTPA